MRSDPIHSLLALAACLGLALAGGASTLEAQGKGTIKIATQSPLSGGQAALGEGIKLGAQLGIEKLKGPLEKQGYRSRWSLRRSGQPESASPNPASAPKRTSW